MTRKAKIVATIGPASQDEDTLEKLIEAGMNVARMNFSHGTHEEHAEHISLVRKVAEKMGKPVGILQDLQGPKIRVGQLDEPMRLSEGETVILYVTGSTPSGDAEKKIPVDFRQLFDSVRTSDRLLLDDGRLALEVVNVKDRHELTAKVIVGGPLSSHKGINLPGVRLRISGFTEKDEADLAFGIEQDVDAVAISFVRTADDVRKVRYAMERFSQGRRMPMLIAKLEKPEALDNLSEILDNVDGVMVARGDLGVELPPERVPVLQKHIICTANARAKLVITATQMLESMITNPLPTRAEASDVANAIFDGTDAVMLSAETASGKYPVEAVLMMDRIVREAETHFFEWGTEQSVQGFEHSDAASMARAAQVLAGDKNVTAVACFTTRGQTAWLMSKIRPRVPVMAFTPEPKTYSRLSFMWGVRPQQVEFVNSLEEMIDHVDSALVRSDVVQAGDQVVIVCGFPVGAVRPPNMALLHTVGES
ncbi:MAG: pyruvate kinase [Anaerolineales bacterium]|jgi:pyruvate kinase|nr:pyruvate kinase [Anaerolineales bacterium]NTW13122.1 pyruvate kinase [Anaerolineales bacterium]